MEFISRIRKYAKSRNLTCVLNKKRGKGSHVTLYLGDRRTIVRNPRDELKKGTLYAMLKQLGVEKTEL